MEALDDEREGHVRERVDIEIRRDSCLLRVYRERTRDP
jgi:hypothetical protein